MTIAILAAAMLIQTGPGAPTGRTSPKWTLVASDEEGEYWLDPASLRQDGPLHRFRMRQVTREAARPTILVDYQLDCAGRTIAIESLEALDASGALVATRTVPADWLDEDPIYAGSIDSRFYARICPAGMRRQLAERPPPPVMIMPTIAPPPVLAIPSPPPPPPPPPPPGGFPMRRAQPVESLNSLFRASDYPAAALRNEEQGSILYRLTIDKAGRPTACAIVSSSGSPSLDNATCRIIMARARFRPAKNAKGKKMADSVLGRIVWRIPDDPPAPPPAPQ